MSTSLAILIPTYNAEKIIDDCLASIKKTYFDNFDIIIVDGASTDQTLNKIKKKKLNKVFLLKVKYNIGYAGLINFGVQNTNYSHYLVANPDTIFLKNTIYPMYEIIKKDKKVALVGCQQLFPNRKTQRSFDNFPSILDTFFMIFGKNFFFKIYHSLKQYFFDFYEVPFIDGACFLFDKKSFLKVNGFDESYFFYSEEVDYCYKLKKKNYKIIFTKNSQIIHLRGATSTQHKIKIKFLKLLVKNKVKFYRNFNSSFKTSIYIYLNYLYNTLCYIFSYIFFIILQNKYRKFRYKYFYVLKSLWFKKINNLKDI